MRINETKTYKVNEEGEALSACKNLHGQWDGRCGRCRDYFMSGEISRLHFRSLIIGVAPVLFSTRLVRFL